MSRIPIIFSTLEYFFLQMYRANVLSLRGGPIPPIPHIPVIYNHRIRLSLATELGQLYKMLVKRLIQIPGQNCVNRFLWSLQIFSRRHQFRYSSESRVTNINGHTTSVCSIDFHATGPFMLTGSFNAAKLWWLDYQNGLTPTWQGNDASHFKGIAFHPREKLMVTNTSQSIPVLLHFSYAHTSGCTLTCLAWLQGHTRAVLSVDFHKRLPFFATGSLDTYVILWELLPPSPKPNVKRVCSFSHGSEVFCVAFHPFLPLIATSGRDNFVRLWQLPSETSQLSLLATLVGHSGWIYSVMFHPTKPFLVTGSQDHTIKLWRILDDFTVSCLETLHGHTDTVNFVRFHQNGRFIVSTGMDSTDT
jgi:WD40 repeat protein